MQQNQTQASTSVLEELEVRRRALSEEFKIIIVVGLLCIAAFSGIGALIGGVRGAGIGLAIALVAVFAIYIWVHGPKQSALVKDFKQLVVQGELSRVFGEVVYDPTRSFPEDLIRSLKVIEDADQITGNDWVEGTYAGRHFYRADLRMERELPPEPMDDDSSGIQERKYEDLFTGSLLQIDREIPYPGRLLLYTEGFHHIAGDFVPGRLLSMLGNKQNEVVTESIEFNRRYDAVCADQVAARIILTPRRMAAFMDMDRSIGKAFALVFQDRQMYAFLPGAESFEMVSGGQNMQEQQKRVAGQVDDLARIIDHLVKIEQD